MSWEIPIARGAISNYYSKKDGTTTDATSAVAAFIIDILDEKAGYIRDKFGDTKILYTWFHSAEPSSSLTSPAVAISVMSNERDKLGANIDANDGTVLFGGLMDNEMTMLIIADSPRQREAISNRIFQVLNKWVHLRESPIHYIMRMGFGDDRGFSSIERFMMSSLWQNFTEDKYIKIDIYNLGYVEFYEDDDEIVDWQVIGSIKSDDIPNPYSTNISMRIDFTINL